MTIERLSHADLSDDELLNEVRRLAGAERRATARLVAALAGLDARRLYLGQGCPSLFVYCTRVLRLSEHAAYGRIEAARASRRFPVLREMLAGRRSDADLALPDCSSPDRDESPRSAGAHTPSKQTGSGGNRRVAAAAARRADRVRKLPEQSMGSRIAEPTLISASTECESVVATSPVTESRPAPRPVVQPLAPERYKLQLTVGRETRDKLHRVQSLMRHSLPSGDLSTILDQALDLLLADLERKKIAACARPRPSREAVSASRHIPAAVRRLVWTRDGGCCAFVGSHGRCGETGFGQKLA